MFPFLGGGKEGKAFLQLNKIRGGKINQNKIKPTKATN